jgi:hypothetical protein
MIEEIKKIFDADVVFIPFFFDDHPGLRQGGTYLTQATTPGD